MTIAFEFCLKNCLGQQKRNASKLWKINSLEKNVFIYLCKYNLKYKLWTYTLCWSTHVLNNHVKHIYINKKSVHLNVWTRAHIYVSFQEEYLLVYRSLQDYIETNSENVYCNQWSSRSFTMNEHFGIWKEAMYIVFTEKLNNICTIVKVINTECLVFYKVFTEKNNQNLLDTLVNLFDKSILW